MNWKAIQVSVCDRKRCNLRVFTLGCLPFLFKRVQEQGHAVVVVAEGAGEELLGKNVETDAGGNRKLPPIGVSSSRSMITSVLYF